LQEAADVQQSCCQGEGRRLNPVFSEQIVGGLDPTGLRSRSNQNPAAMCNAGGASGSLSRRTAGGALAAAGAI
jgi:hypothetical protein